MLRTAIPLLSFAFAASILSADEPASDELKKLQGEWQEVERDTQGKKTSKADPGFSGLRFVIAGDQLTVNNRRKTIKLDPAKEPKAIDMISHDGWEIGQTTAAIYKLEKDRLTICQPYWSGDTTARPTELKAAADDGRMLLILERVPRK